MEELKFFMTFLTNLMINMDHSKVGISEHNLFKKWEFWANRANTEKEKEDITLKIIRDAENMIQEISFAGVSFGDDGDIHRFVDINESINEFSLVMYGHLHDMWYNYILKLEEDSNLNVSVNKMILDSKLGHMFKKNDDPKENYMIRMVRHMAWRVGAIGLGSLSINVD